MKDFAASSYAKHELQINMKKVVCFKFKLKQLKIVFEYMEGKAYWDYANEDNMWMDWEMLNDKFCR